MLKKKKAFTLIELMIVVVIIAILAAVLIVAYSGITKRSRRSAQLQQLNDGIQGAAICTTGGGTVSTTVSATTNTPICSDQSLTTATWPKNPGNATQNEFNFYPSGTGGIQPVYDTTTTNKQYDYGALTMQYGSNSNGKTDRDTSLDITCTAGGQCI